MTIILPKVQLFYSGQWNDESPRVLYRDAVRISRGVRSEGGRASPTGMGFSLKNGDSRFSIANPASPLFGKLGRNNPVRAYLGTPHPGAANFDLVDTTAHVAPSVVAPTADGLLLCAWAAPADTDVGTYTLPLGMTQVAFVRGPAGVGFGGGQLLVAEQAVAASGATGTRTATFSVAEDYVAASVLLHGTAPAVISANSASQADPVAEVTGLAVGDWLVCFTYHGWLFDPDLLGVPPAFPTDLVEAGWILMADTGVLEAADVDADFMRMRVWARRVRRAGTHRVRVEPLGRTLITLVAVSGVGEWTLRGHAELVSMPPRRDLSGNDRWVPVEAAGILRRLGASTAEPLESPLTRVAQRRPEVVVRHWPLENDAVREGVPDRDLSVLALDPEPEFGIRPTFGADGGPAGTPRSLLLRPTHEVLFRASVADGWAVQVWLTPGEFANAGGAGGTHFVLVPVLGSLTFSWTINTGSVGLFLLDEDGFSAGSDTDTLPLDGPALVTIVCSGNGSNVTAVVEQIRTGASVTLTVVGAAKPFVTTAGGVVVSNSATFGAEVTGRDVYVSHVMVGLIGLVDETLRPLILDAGRAYEGEPAARRILRLCQEEGIPAAVVGDPGVTAMMGTQRTATLLELLAECEDADHGILHEPREFIGLAYRTVGSLYNQTAVATVDFTGGEVAAPWEPAPDDRLIRNDVIVTRRDGASARSVQETGPLNVGDPGTGDPEAVGRYPHDPTLSLASNVQTPGQARWLRLLGTQPEPRFPSIAANLLREQVLSLNPALVAALAGLDVGDKIVVQNPAPGDLPPDDVEQLWVGSDELLTQVDWELAGNTVPASPYNIAEVAHPNFSIIGSDTAIAQALDTTETVVNISCGAGPDWVHEVDFDILVGGEAMTVTAVGAMSGTFPNRFTTLTVTRSVNGVVKSHTLNAPILFFHRSYIGL